MTNNDNICIAIKQDGFQCTRRSKPDGLYCGKHIDNRKNYIEGAGQMCQPCHQRIY